MRGKGRSFHTVSVTAEVDVGDVIDDLNDDDLAAYGLRKIEAETTPDELRDAIYTAAQSCNFAAVVRAIEVMAWELDGKILVTRLAA